MATALSGSWDGAACIADLQTLLFLAGSHNSDRASAAFQDSSGQCTASSEGWMMLLLALWSSSGFLTGSNYVR